MKRKSKPKPKQRKAPLNPRGGIQQRNRLIQFPKKTTP
jgi:hypothetical protein